jgi:hypothetical protein
MCPLKFNLSDIDSEIILCEKVNCAWWNSWKDSKGIDRGCCSILSIAGRLDDMLISGLPVQNNY